MAMAALHVRSAPPIMNQTETHRQSRDPLALPEFYRAVPIEPFSETSSLRLCVLISREAEASPGGWRLLGLRELPTGRVFLGCITDQKQRVIQWVELWVQNVESTAEVFAGHAMSIFNKAIDVRWRNEVANFFQANPHLALETQWCRQAAPPIHIDGQTGERLPLDGTTPAAEFPKVCQDDTKLKNAGLPKYATSLARYLELPGPAAPRFLPLTSACVKNSETIELGDLGIKPERCVVFNPHGGMVFVASFYPISYREYSDLLSGRPWAGLADGKRNFYHFGFQEALGSVEVLKFSELCLFQGDGGVLGRMSEMFALKLNLLLQACKQARRITAQTKAPLLNLSPDSFRIRLAPVATSLPVLWSFQCQLVRPGEALSLPIEGTAEQYFIKLSGNKDNPLFYPEGTIFDQQGEGELRITNITELDGQGTQVVEGTLAVRAPVKINVSDLFWISVPVAGNALTISGHISKAEQLARRELPFRSLPHQFPPGVKSCITRGFRNAGTRFGVIPMLNAPCDLYALAIIGALTFLTGRSDNDRQAVDDLLQLAREVAEQHDGVTPLADRIGVILNSDERWLDRLGPHNLTGEEITPELAFQAVPAAIWFELLGLLVRLLPGTGPDSWCRDLGDAPAADPETVYDAPIQSLTALHLRARSLILNDADSRAEIYGAIQNVLQSDTI
jgi:hypothetical protein